MTTFDPHAGKSKPSFAAMFCVTATHLRLNGYAKIWWIDYIMIKAVK